MKIGQTKLKRAFWCMCFGHADNNPLAEGFYHCLCKEISDTSLLTFPARKKNVQAACRPVTVQLSRPSDYHFDIRDTEKQARRN